MATSSDVPGLVDALYRGVVSDERWFAALDRVSEHFRGSSLFFGTDGGGPKDVHFVGHRVDPDCVELIQGPLATPEANPFLPAMAAIPIGRAVETSRICGDARLVRSPLFSIAMQPFGFRYVIGALLERAEQGRVFVAFSRPADGGDYQGEEVEALNLLLPHLTRALHLREELESLRIGQTAAQQALEDLPRGLLLLSRPTLAIMFANREARRILALRDGLLCSGARLSGSRRLLSLLAEADGLAPCRSCARLIVSLPRPSGASPWSLIIGHLPTSADTAIGSGQPCIAITLIDPEHEKAPAELELQMIYGLTPSEARPAAALCTGDLKNVAVRLGISYNTAKTHLRAIFDKVGVSRQSALVRRITLDLSC